MDTVRELRRDAGISQAELARRSGVAQPNIAAYEAGRRHASPSMIDRLRAAARALPSEVLSARRTDVVQTLSRHGLSTPRVFGSVARGHDTPDSDVDLVVDATATTDLLDLIDAADELEQLLGFRVDLITSRSLPAGHEIARTMTPL